MARFGTLVQKSDASVTKISRGNSTRKYHPPEAQLNLYRDASSQPRSVQSEQYIHYSSVLVDSMEPEDSLTTLTLEVSQMWRVENLGIKDILVADNRKKDSLDLLKAFNESVRYTPSGELEVALPYNGNESRLSDNHAVAYRRLENLYSTFNREKNITEKCDNITADRLKAGIIEVATPQMLSKNLPKYFIPHRAVIKESVERDPAKDPRHQIHLREYAMNLREYVVNDEETMSSLVPTIAASVDPIKLLGYQWNRKTDTLTIKIAQIESLHPTKREVASKLAATFGPLGIASPIMVPFKRLIRKIWGTDVTWKQLSPAELVKDWTQLKWAFADRTISVPRQVNRA
uniref:Reverse transcriptase n=2 Tax=Caenorhabditis tropicalis TaxID=1561998 RepID=A0A1I7TI08_9PELO